MRHDQWQARVVCLCVLFFRRPHTNSLTLRAQFTARASPPRIACQLLHICSCIRPFGMELWVGLLQRLSKACLLLPCCLGVVLRFEERVAVGGLSSLVAAAGVLLLVVRLHVVVCAAEALVKGQLIVVGAVLLQQLLLRVLGWFAGVVPC